MTSEEVAACVREDVGFYTESNGGVTISGGEPTAQKEFLLETLGRIKRNGIHTAIETCGYFPGTGIAEFASVADLFLFDIKHIDAAKHEHATGVRPDQILGNFRTIVAEFGSVKIIPRIPLIPGFNTDPDSIVMIALFLRESGYTGCVHVLPYNSLSRHKYDKLGKGDLYTDRGTLEESRVDEITGVFEKQGYGVYCNG